MPFLQPRKRLRLSLVRAQLHPMRHDQIRTLPRRLHQLASFHNVVTHRLLHIHMLARRNRMHRNQRVTVIRRRNDHPIQLLILHKLPIILIHHRLHLLPLKFLQPNVDRPLIHIAQRHNPSPLLPHQIPDVMQPLPVKPANPHPHVRQRRSRPITSSRQ